MHQVRIFSSQCKGFKCPQAPQAAAETDQPPNCCCRRLLYSQPDFVNVKSLLEEHCEKRGFMVLILPKYHCELNPIEMVWGRAKYCYRLNPPSTKEEDVERYATAALAAVTIDEMPRLFLIFYLCWFLEPIFTDILAVPLGLASAKLLFNFFYFRQIFHTFTTCNYFG